MQKVQKIVINSIFYITIVLFSNSSYAQTVNDDDYILLNKVAAYKLKSEDSIFFLVENENFSKEELQKYYKHSFLKEKNIVNIIGYKYNKKGEKVIDYYDDNVQSIFQKKWYSRYKSLDSVLTQKDFENLLTKKNNTKWKKNKLPKRIKLIGQNESISKKEGIASDIGSNYTHGNIISKPYYSLNKKYAILQYKTPITPYILFLFKKDKDDWVKIGLIKQHF